MKSDPADLMAVMFDGVDKLQHLCWRFIDPASYPEHPTAWEREMITLCDRYFSALDGLIAGIVEAAGPEATVVLASDHGFGPTRDVFHVNSWLERNGYLTWADGQGGDARGDTEVGFAEMTRHVHALDWSRTVAYAATPSSQGIHIVDRVPGSEAPMPRQARAQLTEEIAAKLRDVRRPHDDALLVDEVWTREQAFAGPFEDLGPDLSLVLADGGTLSILPSETIVARRPEARGHHRWEGIFLAAGPGIRAGASVRNCRSSTWRHCCCINWGCRRPRTWRAACRRRSSSRASSSDALRGASRGCAGAGIESSRQHRARSRGADRCDGAAARAGVRGVSNEVGNRCRR